MFTEDICWKGMILTEDLLESITRWDSIVAPHEPVTIKGGKLKTWGASRLDMTAQSAEYMVTEKIDGTNMACVLLFEGNNLSEFLIRSRKEILGSMYDQVVQDKFQVFTTLLPLEDRIEDLTYDLAQGNETAIVVVYGELYGAGIQKGGKYRPDPNWRIFGAKLLMPDFVEWFNKQPREMHQHYRWEGMISQPALYHHALSRSLPVAPILCTINGQDIVTVEATKQLLERGKHTSMVTQYDSKPNESNHALEGLVVRCDFPFYIYKIKYEDYL